MSLFESEKFSLSDISSQLSGNGLTASRAAWLLCFLPPKTWRFKEEHDMLLNGVKQAGTSPLPCAEPSNTSKPRKDSRQEAWIVHPSHDSLFSNHSPTKPKIFTDYEFAREALRAANCLLSENLEESDFLLTVSHISNFYSLPMHLKLCQFPYEGGLVRKDLLPLTVRRYCCSDNGADPIWWLPCFDLTTEFHLFLNCVLNRSKYESSLSSNLWIVKPAQGTRGLGHHILAPQTKKPLASEVSLSSDDDFETLLYGSEAYSMLNEAAQVTELFPTELLPQPFIKISIPDYNQHVVTTDKIVQLLVHKPLLVTGRKFDIRLYVFVRSFVPFEAYMHTLFYARLANKLYNVKEIVDQEVVLTVSAYNEDMDIANKQTRMTSEDLKSQLIQENPSLDYDAMILTMQDMVKDLFSSVATSIGEWPQCSAYYGVDAIFDHHCDLRPQAKLIEVNFMGDWKGVKGICRDEDQFNEWVNDLVTCLATRDDMQSNPRLIKL